MISRAVVGARPWSFRSHAKSLGFRVYQSKNQNEVFLAVELCKITFFRLNRCPKGGYDLALYRVTYSP